MEFEAQRASWVASWGASSMVRFDTDCSRHDIPTIYAPAGLADDGVRLTSIQRDAIALVNSEDGRVVRIFDGCTQGMDAVTYVTWS